MSSPPTHTHQVSNVEQRLVQRQAEAFLCDRCGWPTADGCTCRPQPGARRDVDLRHREAVARAQASGWAEHTRLLNLVRRRWAA